MYAIILCDVLIFLSHGKTVVFIASERRSAAYTHYTHFTSKWMQTFNAWFLVYLNHRISKFSNFRIWSSFPKCIYLFRCFLFFFFIFLFSSLPNVQRNGIQLGAEEREPKWARERKKEWKTQKCTEWKWQITRMLSSCFTIFIGLLGKIMTSHFEMEMQR